MTMNLPPINSLVADAEGSPSAPNPHTDAVADSNTHAHIDADTSSSWLADAAVARLSSVPLSQQQPSSQDAMASHHRKLANLPPELLNNIASSLPTNAFNALRLTSKQLEDKLFPYWANCFFKKKQFMITQFSLQTLVDISRHPTLSRCVKSLIIGLDHLKAAKPQTIPTLQEYQRYRAALASQERLLHTGAAVDLLVTALRNLPNLETIDIRDFNSATRFRDTNDTRARAASARVPEWRSYGASEHHAWLRHLNNSLLDPYSQLSHEFVVQVFKIVLTSLGRSAPPVKSLYVLLRNSQVGLRDDALAVFPALDVGIPAFLQGLTRLHLDMTADVVRIEPSIWQFPSPLEVTPSTSCFDPSTTNIRNFLSMTPNVSWLRLNFTTPSMHSAVTPLLLCWLALKPDGPSTNGIKTTWSAVNPAPVALPLKRLDLGNLTVTPDVLAAVIRKFDLLEDLTLKRTALLCDRSKYPDEETDHGSPWPRFFRRLPARAPNLKSLNLRNLRGGEQVHLLDDVVFDDGTAKLDVNFANRPRRFVIEIRDLDKDPASLERLAGMTWSNSSFMRARSGQTGHEDTDEGSDISEDESDLESEDPEEPVDGESEVDEVSDDDAEQN